MLKAIKLPLNEKIILIKCILLLPIIKLLLSIIGYNKSYSFLLRFHSFNKFNINNNSLDKKVDGIRKIVIGFSRSKYIRSTCLHESILLWNFLGREGIKSKIIFGTNENIEHFKAHAWVYYDNKALNSEDNISEIYKPIN